MVSIEALLAKVERGDPLTPDEMGIVDSAKGKSAAPLWLNTGPTGGNGDRRG